jgi:hypothetical protein
VIYVMHLTHRENDRSAALHGCPSPCGRPKGLRYVRPLMAYTAFGSQFSICFLTCDMK